MKRKCMGVLLAAWLVAGCGGGSDAVVDTRANNAATESKTLSEASIAPASTEAGVTASAVQSVLEVQQALFEQGVLTSAIANMVSQENAINATPTAVVGTRQLVFSEGRTCSGGGSLSLTWTDVDLNKKASVGDVVRLLANTCVDTLSTAAINGAMTIDIVQLVTDATGQPLSGQLRMRFAGLTMGTLIVSGPAQVEFDALQRSLTTSELTVNADKEARPAVYDLTAQAVVASGLLSLQGQIALLLPDPAQPQGATNTWVRQALRLTTGEALRFENGHPVQGQLRLVAEPGDGSTGAALFTAEGTTGQLIGSDGASTFSTAVKPW